MEQPSPQRKDAGAPNDPNVIAEPVRSEGDATGDYQPTAADSVAAEQGQEATEPTGDAKARRPEKPAPVPSDQTVKGESLTAPPVAKPRSSTRHPKVVEFGDFRLLNKLGVGGMGTVFKAHQSSLDRTVAIKILARDLADKPRFVERFLREARVLARLDHPNILRCFEVKQERGYHYYAMEYMDGGSLESWLRKLGRFTIGDALHIGLACASALEYAHEQNLIHRDIKPENLLLTNKGVVKVADMGLVKALEEDVGLTESGVSLGTPTYMSPEQTRNAKYADARSDIYALGCMLYKLVTGKPAFKGDTLAELLEAKERDRVTPAHKLNPDIPNRLDLMLEKMMARRPEHRYQTCTELIADLEGLRLANPVLSFMPQSATGTSGTHRALSASSGSHRALSAPGPRPSSPELRMPPAAPAPEFEADAVDPSVRWYLMSKDRTGRVSTRKLTTTALINLIRRGDIDPETPACQELNGSYRPLITFPQFQGLLQLQHNKDRGDRRTAQFQLVYEQLEREDKTRRRRRWLRDFGVMIGGWVKFLIWAIFLGLFGVVIYILATWAISKLGEKGDDLMNHERPVPTR
jgi:eukaryotic-like serine/threonine-protein kinase